MDSTEQKPGQPLTESYFFRSPQKRRLIFCLLLALATIALYNSVTRAPFLNFDDQVYVTDNPQVRAGLTWNTVVWAFRTPKAFDWHPITWLSYALDWQIFGLNPAGYHTINVLLHAANAVLLFLILESATGLAWRSLAVAALFALHPINVESVAWISERKTVLSMFFFLLALAAYGWYARRPGVGRYLAVTVAYALGLMSKAQVITFPFALLLLDYWPLGRLAPHPARPEEVGGELAVACPRSLFLEIDWGEGALVCAVGRERGHHHEDGGGGVQLYGGDGGNPGEIPALDTSGNAAISYVKYLGKAFWPVNLALVYPHPGFAISIPAAVLSALAIVAVSILAVIFRRRRASLGGVVLVSGNAGADDRTGSRLAFTPWPTATPIFHCWEFS